MPVSSLFIFCSLCCILCFFCNCI